VLACIVGKLVVAAYVVAVVGSYWGLVGVCIGWGFGGLVGAYMTIQEI
jgi:hypothetical protein